jgi:hypothetical protein
LPTDDDVRATVVEWLTVLERGGVAAALREAF